MSVRRTVVAAGLACAAGFSVACATTDGFQAYTLESARRLSALRSPRPVPDVPLVLADGGTARLSELREPVLLVDFVYTSCPTLCTALGSVYATLQRRLAPDIAAGRVRLVSISFDTERDGVEQLRAYRERHTLDHSGWALGHALRASDLRGALDAFGVVVIPDGLGGYVHNAAMHVVGPRRTLMAILDPADIDGVVGLVREKIAGIEEHVAVR